MEKQTPKWATLRGVVLFFSGLAGVAWETFHGPVNPSLLVVFGAMMGLELFLRKDTR